jgi:hypothetical protein
MGAGFRWPYDIHSFVDVAPILANADYRVLIPYLRGYGDTRFLSSDTPRKRPTCSGGYRCDQLSGCAQSPEGPRCGVRLGRQNGEPDGVSLARARQSPGRGERLSRCEPGRR